MMQIAKTIFGIYTNRDNAENAISDLETAGYRTKDISLVMRDTDEAHDISDTTGVDVAEGAVTGATTGAVVGGIAGLLVGVGTIAIPGIGGILIGGPLAAALGLTGAAATTVSGAATGAVAGGIIGALMGFGIPREQAEVYESKIREGAILLAVPTYADREDEVWNIMEQNGATDINSVTQPMDRFMRREVDADIDENYVPRSRFDKGSYMTMGAKGGTTRSRKRRKKIS